MPSDKVQFQYQQIEEIAQQAYQKSDTAAQVRQRLMQQLQALQDGGWIGQGAETFYAEMNHMMIPAVTRLENALEQLGGVLRRSSDTMREAEEQAAQLFRADGGGVPGNGGGSTGPGTGGGATNPGTGGGSTNPGTGGGSTGPGGTPPSTQTTVGKAIDVISKLLGIGDGGAEMLKGLFKNVDSFGEFSQKFKLGPVGDVLSIVAVGVENWGKPDFFEKVGDKTVSVGLEMLLTKNPIGAAVMVISDANQLVGQSVSGLAGLLNENAQNPALAEAISRFDSTITNADAGGVIDSVGTVGVDLIQAHWAGMKEVFNNPNPLNIIQAITPGGLIGVGLMSDPGMAMELGQNSLVMLGTAADFVVGVGTLGPAYANMAENVMNVGLQNVGFSEGFSETVSGGFGTALSTISSMGNPLAGILYDNMPQIDFSDMAKSLFE